MRYLAVLHKDPGSDFGAHATDVPGTYGTGATPEAALAG
ncbi:MAG: type II toxin-antitoxin system HicB family antitoxin [Alphaproteobacteria bacterium]|nr:type II toxin-antitoxin system HicB family antitoxin [Alphaproteobacteria bacterium]